MCLCLCLCSPDPVDVTPASPLTPVQHWYHICRPCLVWTRSGMTPSSHRAPTKIKACGPVLNLRSDLKQRENRGNPLTNIWSHVRDQSWARFGDLSSRRLTACNMLDRFTQRADLHHMGNKSWQGRETFFFFKSVSTLKSTSHVPDLAVFLEGRWVLSTNWSLSFYGHPRQCLIQEQMMSFFFLTSPTYHISENIFKNIALTHVFGQLPLFKYILALHQSSVFYCSLTKLNEKIPIFMVRVGLRSLNFSDLAMQRNEWGFNSEKYTITPTGLGNVPSCTSAQKCLIHQSTRVLLGL